MRELIEFLGSLLVCLASIMTTTSGMGGGGLYLSIYLLVFGFNPIHAVAFSNITIFGSATANLVVNSLKRHPWHSGPLIDYDAVQLMEPATMFGTIVGSLVHRWLPPWLIILSLNVLLVVLAIHVIAKGIREYKELAALDPTAINAALPSAAECMAQAESDRIYTDRNHYTSTFTGTNTAASNGISNGRRTSPATRADQPSVFPQTYQYEVYYHQPLAQGEIHDTPAYVYYVDRLISVMAIFSLVVILNLLKCVDGEDWYYTANVIICVWVIIVSSGTGYMLHRSHRRGSSSAASSSPSASSSEEVAGKVDWTAQALILCPLVCVCAGIFAGTYGIGGGFMKAPLLMKLGLQNEAAAATSATMIWFTSLVATTSFFAFGDNLWAYNGYFFSTGLLSTAVGQYVGYYFFSDKYRSIVVACSMGVVMGASAVLMTFDTLLGYKYEHSSKREQFSGFEAFCGTSRPP